MVFIGNGSTAQDQFNLQIRGNSLFDDSAIILAQKGCGLTRSVRTPFHVR
jgi:hypothetical protein